MASRVFLMSLEEEEQRRSIWEKNTLLIEAHNLEYEQGMHSYQLGMNHLGDMGSCWSCWPISAAGALDGQLMRSRRKLVPLSPQNLVDCVRSNYGCMGGYMTNAYKYAMKKGISSERKYPYMGLEQKFAFNRSDRVAQIWDFMELPEGNERVLRAVVVVHGPVSMGIQARSTNFIFYKSGVYHDPKFSRDDLNHAVLVVGYGITPTCKKFWIVKNRSGDAQAYSSARANLKRGIKRAKHSHKLRSEEHFTCISNPQRMWQGIQAITDYKPTYTSPPTSDTSLPDELNNFYARFNRDIQEATIKAVLPTDHQPLTLAPTDVCCTEQDQCTQACWP
ncbi:cathepsin K-like [Anguilla anguilla]|uniref:cathepsin K-like n=1 Tax=Anguilla anguilla TaxID=7936 RepID=UPI0015ACA1C0|nr:cathepsin K-like [Anguilla anguilla]